PYVVPCLAFCLERNWFNIILGHIATIQKDQIYSDAHSPSKTGKCVDPLPAVNVSDDAAVDDSFGMFTR
ncbi:hypothetical protein ABFV57_34365, partial [Pseudomonas neuropathica]|uniref:hypothetical protein n=1 Tax=Pseudomonas neuropathica TaxID=2730425 RepID=UPI0034D5DB8C